MMQPMMMMQSPMMQPMILPQQSQPSQQSQTTTTGANAGELIKEQLASNSSNSNSTGSILDMEPEKPASEKSQDSSNDKGEGKRVIKLG
jgi:hypothetical protein